MATPTMTRLPWRTIARSTSKNPSQHLFRTPAATQTQCTPRRWATTERKEIDESKGIPRPTGPQAVLGGLAVGKPNPVSPFDGVDTDIRDDVRLPRAVQAVYLRPLRREPTHGLPSCDLQLRSYSVRNLEFMCDFALRAAYYLHLPASGPVPLPRIVERWTVPKGHFIHKKTQENFERKTLRRLIQIKDGHPETVEVWLAFLRKHAYYGVGMKANLWEFTGLDVAKTMDAELEKLKEQVDSTLDLYSYRGSSPIAENLLETLNTANFRKASGFSGPMIDTPPEYLPRKKKGGKGGSFRGRSPL